VEAWLAAEGRWASELVKGRSVVDVTPGNSPAGAELALAAESIVIVSPRVSIIEALQERLPPTAEGCVAEPSSLPFDDGSFSAAIYLEAGRSTPAETEDVLRELERVLDKRDGFLLTSLGIRKAPVDEWSAGRQTLTATLDKLFTSVSVIELTVSLVATFTNERPARSVTIDRQHSNTPQPVLDTIVLASKGQLPDTRKSRELSFPIDPALWERDRDAMLETVRRAQIQAFRAEQAAEERPELIRQLFASEQVLATEFDRRRRNEVSPRVASLIRDELAAARAQQPHIESLREAFADAQAQIADLKSSTSWQITKPLRVLKRLLR
jgi:hypothetical protein